MTALQEQARALGDPTRHQLFEYLVHARRPVAIAELAEHLGVHHNAVRQHLAKLTAAGLVRAGSHASGGPGRPRLMYEVAPEADGRWREGDPYQRLASLLGEMVATGDAPEDVGRRFGHVLADAAHRSEDDASGALERIVDALADQGFAPRVEPHDDDPASQVVIRLDWCPFSAVAAERPEIVCRLHHGITVGLADGAPDLTVDELVVRDPHRAGCEIRLSMPTRR